jgi:hypothetical protein
MFGASKRLVVKLINFLRDLYVSSDELRLNVTKLDLFNLEKCLPRWVRRVIPILDIQDMETTQLERVSYSEDRGYSLGLTHKVYRAIWTPDESG